MRRQRRVSGRMAASTQIAKPKDDKSVKLFSIRESNDTSCVLRARLIAEKVFDRYSLRGPVTVHVVCFFFCQLLPLPIGCFFYRLLLCLDRRHPTGGLAHAFAARFHRRSGSSFRRAPCFRRRSCSSSRRMLLSHAFCLCLSPVASSPRSRALSSSASPVLLGF
jgi:hypothetical protein